MPQTHFPCCRLSRSSRAEQRTNFFSHRGRSGRPCPHPLVAARCAVRPGPPPLRPAMGAVAVQIRPSRIDRRARSSSGVGSGEIRRRHPLSAARCSLLSLPPVAAAPLSPSSSSTRRGRPPVQPLSREGEQLPVAAAAPACCLSRGGVGVY